MYAHQNNLEFKITSTNEPVVGRVFSCHADNRCADLRSKTWPKYHRDEICRLINEKFGDIAQISYHKKVGVACLHHKIKGGAIHFHLGVRP